MKKFFFLFIILACSSSLSSNVTTHEPQKVNGKIEGIYWMVSFIENMNADAAKYQVFLDQVNKELSTDKYIEGILLYLHWVNMEPQKGAYSQDFFKKLDAIIEVARKNNKNYKLLLVAGRKTPGFVYDEGAKYVTTSVGNPYNREYGKAMRIPLPWDSIYLENYYRNISFLAKKFNADKHFVATSITVATSYSPEWMIEHDNEKEVWAPYTDKVQLVTKVWKDGIDFFAKTYPDKQITIEASSFPFPKMRAEARSILQYGCDKLHERFSIQINQLQGNINLLNTPHYQNVYLFKDQMHAGFQNVGSWQWPKMIERQGSMEMSVYNFLQANGKYYELWDADGANPATVKKLYDMIQHARSLGLDKYREELQQKGLFIPPHEAKW